MIVWRRHEVQALDIDSNALFLWDDNNVPPTIFQIFPSIRKILSPIEYSKSLFGVSNFYVISFPFHYDVSLSTLLSVVPRKFSIVLFSDCVTYCNT